MSSRVKLPLHKLALTYFVSPPGRGHAIREAFAIGNIAFDDIRLERSSFATLKSEGHFPMGSVPVLDVDGLRLCESNAILRFAGKLSNLYPSDPVLALRVDEILDIVEDIASIFKPTRFITDPQLRDDARHKLIANGGAMHSGFALLARRHAANNNQSPFFVGGQLSIADLKVLGWRTTAASGHYAPVSSDWVDSAFPSLGKALAAAQAEVDKRKSANNSNL